LWGKVKKKSQLLEKIPEAPLHNIQIGWIGLSWEAPEVRRRTSPSTLTGRLLCFS